ncbi:MAG: spore coat protein CotJB [Clostridiales bacterium]|nr:spore coat protein CotJB [Clostridiales bacterium]
MQKQQLAMAELPVQEMEELYAPEQALAAGTAFPDLDLPFFAVPEEMMETAPAAEDYQGKTEEQKKMMKELTEVSFMADDLNLYLDTHPEDGEAFAACQEYIRKRQELLSSLAQEQYPLCAELALQPEDRKKAPCPWKGGGACVVL